MFQPPNPSPDQPRESLDELRQRVVAEALTWLRTPWHHEARVKGAGVDCGQFLIGVFSRVGLVREFQPEHYPADWHLHKDERRFLAYLLEYAAPVGAPLPGDVAMFQYGRHEAHGSIVIDAAGPVIIHAWRDEGMVTITDLATSPIASRFAGYYRMRGL